MLAANSFSNVKVLVQSAALAGKLGAGRNFYVGNGTAQHQQLGANDGIGNDGTDPSRPWATLAYAITQCTAGRGDNIILLPGHAESITGADGVALSVSGVTVLGLGSGALTPTLTFTTAAAASFDVTGANCTVRNVILSNDIDQQTAMVNVSAADATFDGVTFRMTKTLAATKYALIGILTTAAANRMVVSNCLFTGNGAGAAAGTVRHTNSIQIVGGDGITIKDSQFLGRVSATLGHIQVVTTLSSNLSILRCYLSGSTTAAAKVIVDTITGSTGVLDGNRYQILTGTAPVTAATMAWGLNYYAAAIATAMTAV